MCADFICELDGNFSGWQKKKKKKKVFRMSVLKPGKSPSFSTTVPSPHTRAWFMGFQLYKS